MELSIKIIIDSHPNYKLYLRNNSYWYKILNRNPELINNFIEEVKDKYKLRFTDKVNNLIDKIDMVERFMGALR